jgi:hypothetical protein
MGGLDSRLGRRGPSEAVFSGQFTWAIEVTAAHMQLDPFYPPLVPLWYGHALYMLEQYSAMSFRGSPRHCFDGEQGGSPRPVSNVAAGGCTLSGSANQSLHRNIERRKWVRNAPGQALTSTAEVPPISDSIAAAQRTSIRCGCA